MSFRRNRGFTLIELTIVIVIMGVLTLVAVPKFDAAMETANVDRGAATLHSIWLAERMYRLETGNFTKKMDKLTAFGLIRESVVNDDDFDYRIRTAKPNGVTLRARRQGSQRWRGRLDMDREGEVSGAIRSGDIRVEP